MEAETRFQYWMRGLIVLFIVLFLYIITADRHAPLTTEARVQGHVVQIAPEVSGKITTMLVKNNQFVKAGEPLFVIDDRKYKIAEDKARLSLRSAQEQEASLYSQRGAALASVSRAKANCQNAQREYLRLRELLNKNVASQASLDNAKTQYRISEANLQAEKQNLKVIETQLGDEEGHSTPVLMAKNQLNSAELDLHNTVVVAPADGVVTNLQLDDGVMARTGVPLLSFIPSGSIWLAADFREKSVANVNQSFSALVTFDAVPGKIYDFSVSSRDYGVAAAQQQPDGYLTQVESNNRWVRDAQRTRINLSSEEQLPDALFVGSRATVTLYPNRNLFWEMMAKIQIRIAGLFHFIY